MIIIRGTTSICFGYPKPLLATTIAIPHNGGTPASPTKRFAVLQAAASGRNSRFIACPVSSVRSSLKGAFPKRHVSQSSLLTGCIIAPGKAQCQGVNA